MIRYLYISLSILIFMSCKSVKEIENIESATENAAISIIMPHEISLEETLYVEIRNNTSDTIVLINPVIKTIEKFNRGKWDLLKIRYCPCGADCHQAIPRLELTNDQNFTQEWNLKESWCVKNENGILKKKVEKVSSGLYRISFKYEKQKYKPETISKEFTITK